MSAANELFQSLTESAATPVIGKLVGIDADGRASVDFAGNAAGPLTAKTIVTIPPGEADPGRPLLLLFEGNQTDSPIIIGLIGDALVPNVDQTVTLPVGKPEGAVVDGKKVRFDAKNEIQLVCGKSSILLRADGKVVIKGKDILTRASGANKIKGATIGIN